MSDGQLERQGEQGGHRFIMFAQWMSDREECGARGVTDIAEQYRPVQG